MTKRNVTWTARYESHECRTCGGHVVQTFDDDSDPHTPTVQGTCACGAAIHCYRIDESAGS
jgi:hypothetical protein